jgi:hypothetical protein
MSDEYQKGRYDELVERHKELIGLYQHLLWQMQTTQLTSGPGFHGAEVNVYAGSKIDAKAIAWSVGSASAVFSILAYYVGLVPLTFGVTVFVFSLILGLSIHFMKKKEDKENQPLPRVPPIPPQRS